MNAEYIAYNELLKNCLYHHDTIIANQISLLSKNSVYTFRYTIHPVRQYTSIFQEYCPSEYDTIFPQNTVCEYIVRLNTIRFFFIPRLYGLR